ncbi:hypothetical protein [Mesorhizobium xinjiangense]|nr:hypothetical protein [Mesorhizobium xinjiangense]
MKAFLLSIVVLLVVSLGAGFLFHSQFETSAETAFSSGNVRIQ